MSARDFPPRHYRHDININNMRGNQETSKSYLDYFQRVFPSEQIPAGPDSEGVEFAFSLVNLFGNFSSLPVFDLGKSLLNLRLPRKEERIVTNI